MLMAVALRVQRAQPVVVGLVKLAAVRIVHEAREPAGLCHDALVASGARAGELTAVSAWRELALHVIVKAGADWANGPALLLVGCRVEKDQRVSVAAVECPHPVHSPPVDLCDLPFRVDYVHATAVLALDAERSAFKFAERQR